VLSEYLNDNKTETPFATVEPVAESDFRSQKQRRLTDHYVQGVQVAPRGLSEATPVDESTTFVVTFNAGFA